MSKAQDTYRCTRCHKERAGRFTRPKSGAAGSWTQGDSQGRSIPQWYCFTCLPKGQGRDEEEEVAKSIAPIPVATVNIEREHQKGLALVNPILQQLDGLEVIDEPSYLVADELVGEIRKRRRGWEPIWNAIQERVIKPARESLDGIYSINREVDGALEKAEKSLKAKMATFKDKERLELAARNLKRDEDADRTQAIIDETKRKLSDARGSVKGVLTKNLNRNEAHLQTVMETVPLPVVGTSSSTRIVKTIEVDNLQAFAVALTIGPLKDHAIRQLITAAVNEALKAAGWTQVQKDEMAQWPGLKLVESTQIVGH